ncbi:response regulator transcription factor [Psychromonas sp. Urea-02u-13]|uniref:response regulator transcription factor n=1 Tax=Psychromonas sp. Urea-02u-13 TaxID=2058326 RepID=UPI000C31F09D|nr:response regulator transcription factor [Psychromonas sp. Urea-02u-13]PKG37381.1 DNA-binding response regulator [Psychromonas sp. Urea-02u-13]
MNKRKILIIEDDAEISRLTAMYLDVEGYDNQIVDDGNHALQAIKTYQPDLIVLDLMLPGMSGIEICKAARMFYEQPILVLTACDDDVSEVSLLKLGADDFLLKPLKPHVLVARIEALLRRSKTLIKSQQEITQTPVKDVEPRLIINKKNQQVSLDGQKLCFTHAEYQMLLLLNDNSGQVVSREDCCQALRGIDYDVNNRSIDMRISGLRKKLKDDKIPYQMITTIRNKGYMLLNGK